ncbi:MAG TPA: hypothetical protein VNL72_03170 [Gammaproteobacteria bacterium]|nr:hypothetical protein [Gammaproteobacteria bacterium]
MTPSQPRFVLLVPVFLATLPAVAAPYGQDVASASLDYQRHAITWTVDGTLYENRVTAAGLTLHERYADWLVLGLALGYTRVTSDEDPALAGEDVTGGYLGVQADFRLFETKYLDLVGGVRYAYTDVSERTQGGNEIALRWTEGEGRLGAVLKYGPVRLAAGVYRLAIDGDQTENGGVTATRAIADVETEGSYAGLDFYVDRSGYIGVYGENGAREGLRLVFAREF